MAELIFMDELDIARTVSRISFAIIEKNSIENLVLVGIHTRGVVLAQRVSAFLKSANGYDIPVGVLDVTPYRDDIKNLSSNHVDRTNIGFDVNGKNLILADDVLFTGRTVRAALNAINTFGRPKTIQLAVLVDRGHRELPIRPDFIGKNIPTSCEQAVSVKFKETDGIDKVEII